MLLLACLPDRLQCTSQQLHWMCLHGLPDHLEHGLLQDEVLPPELCDVLLDCASGGTEIIEARHAAVDLERGDEEQPPLQHICLPPQIRSFRC